MVDVQEIAKLIHSSRFPLTDEKRLQKEMESAFAREGIPHRPEVHLGARDIVDFMVDEIGLAIEVKIKGSKRAIYKQLERYCEYDEVRTIMLATNVPMGLPPLIGGKPAYLVSLARGWL